MTVYEYYLNQKIPIEKRFHKFLLNIIIAFIIPMDIFYMGKMLGKNPTLE